MFANGVRGLAARAGDQYMTCQWRLVDPSPLRKPAIAGMTGVKRSAGYLGGYAPATDRLAALRVFLSSMAMVMGPTPPGTGVIADAFWDTESKSTSPTRR